jgi:hypothetical protein
MNKLEITFDTNVSEPPRTLVDFTYKISPTVISIFDAGFGTRSVIEDIKAVAQDRVLAPGLNRRLQNHVPGRQWILVACSVGW